jgi:methionine-gamma-lyase
VIHSTTKYLCGHGTVVGGMLTTTCEKLKAAAYMVIKDVGGNPSPFDAWLVNTGIKTLPIRMDKHCSNAFAIARYLDAHPKIARVYYPGLESDPGHAIATRQMGGKYGGMVSFEIDGGVAEGKTIMDNIEVFTLAVSLGCVDSLIQHPASMTHACVPADVRHAAGLPDGLIRVSVGIEDEEDLLQSLDEVLKLI